MAKTIVLATCYDKVNYGSLLQAYATQAAVEQIGFTPVTIDKSGLQAEIGKNRREYYARHLFDIELYRAKLGYVFHRIKQKVNPSFGKKMQARRNKFKAFVEEHIILGPHFLSFEELSKYCQKFEDVVVGSDQLWLPVNISGDFFTLSFVPDPVKKISYSTSFGVSKLPPNYMKKAKEFLKSYYAISVREQSGLRIIEDLGLEATVTCDPTMLIDKDQWARVSDESYPAPDKPYIFCYLLGDNIWHREEVKRISQETGYPILAISHCDEYVAYDDKQFADFQPYDVGPAQWLTLLRNAAYVCTDSYHGTVFSILFERPFTSFRRHNNQGSQSTNSRLDTLLNRMNLQGRICEHPGQTRSHIDHKIDQEELLELVENYRAESYEWLQRALD
ncbi:polysaccharide pyruvyl transferase family protein [Anaerotardibacter muris]|uniref:polysaccharide pyruvyl transferase family protein n=1 Tax=Anaerotardibacter muris TaxID=2941505 RepID=UPI00203EF801|nr:polysaccharide pyruvyl transferase family protein [Anaerotardibacter muris]